MTVNKLKFLFEAGKNNFNSKVNTVTKLKISNFLNTTKCFYWLPKQKEIKYWPLFVVFKFSTNKHPFSFSLPESGVPYYDILMPIMACMYLI